MSGTADGAQPSVTLPGGVGAEGQDAPAPPGNRSRSTRRARAVAISTAPAELMPPANGVAPTPDRGKERSTSSAMRPDSQEVLSTNKSTDTGLTSVLGVRCGDIIAL